MGIATFHTPLPQIQISPSSTWIKGLKHTLQLSNTIAIKLFIHNSPFCAMESSIKTIRPAIHQRENLSESCITNNENNKLNLQGFKGVHTGFTFAKGTIIYLTKGTIIWINTAVMTILCLGKGLATP